MIRYTRHKLEVTCLDCNVVAIANPSKLSFECPMCHGTISLLKIDQDDKQIDLSKPPKMTNPYQR